MSNLSERVYNTVKQRILQWEYPPGHHLTEDALCEEFEVSRIPVREALRMLEENTFVEKIPHRGCRVRQPNLAEINEIYAVRLALETHVVAQLAAEGMDAATWQALFETWDQIERDLESQPASAPQFPEDIAEWAGLDQAFHETLAQAAGNNFMCDMLRMIDERLHFLRLMDITTSDRLLMTCQQHLAVLRQIEARDVMAAQAAIRKNVEFGNSNVKTALHAALAKSIYGT